MKLPNHVTAARFPGASVKALVGAVSAVALPALSLASPSPQIVTAEVVVVPGAASGIERPSTVSADGTGSWVAGVDLVGAGAGATGLYGILSSSGATSPSVLRVPEVLSGFDQQTIFRPQVLGDRIAYSSFALPSSGGFSSWIDDTLIAAEGVAIGSSGLEWTASGTPMLSEGQAFYVRGSAQPVVGGLSRRVVVRYPSEQVVLESGMMIPLLSGPLTAITSFDPTPSGTGWAASVTFNSGNTGQEEQAVIVNGSVLVLPGFIRANTEASSFESFGKVSIDADFDVTFETVDSFGPAVYRNGGAAFRGTSTRIMAVDDVDRVVTFDWFAQGLGLSFEGITLDRPGVASVDADGDGDADAGWALSGTGVGFGEGGFLENGELLAIANVQIPGVGVERAIVKARLLLPNDVECEGAVNSTGYGAELRAVGSDVPAFNDLRLRATNLPSANLVLPLVSRTTGFVANPAGSAGNLCLSGAIGRGPVFSALFATYQVLPVALPQPNGSVAAMSGETWTFQAWYRDTLGGQATSNFTSAISVTFR